MGEQGVRQGNAERAPADFIVPAARPDSYSVREIRQSTRAINAALESLTESDRREFKAQLPRGLLGGFEEVVKFADEAIDRLAGSHLSRRRLLAAVEALPFTSHSDLLHASPERLRRATVKDLPDLLSTSVYLADVDRRAIVEDAEVLLQLVRFLAVLSCAAQRRFPTAPSLLLLFFLLTASLSARGPAGRFLAAPAATIVTRPPGRLVVAEPRVARAPGRWLSLAADRSEGRAGLGARWGSALLT